MNFKYDSIELVNDNNKRVLIKKESRKIIIIFSLKKLNDMV